ncbi:MAG: beta-ketoacyl-ACP synthase II [Desulfobacterales bacterium]|nr:beta-ketoacyl-[acyl-carrier-protein] synthase II [Desulfobacter sp.]MDP6395186.1 beta-ketoacyl-ACP synthase II [Desulfobacterales bacterium]MDP6683239.1 beta-ketoacyl-ACP synthase II [Desulfobacterales bacterium]MDP6806340.1 beta-ketoacyl-ACP synthase II [Desulfobacterales bacterium]
MPSRRVVISGVGLITPLGIGVEETWRELCAGKSGIGEITRFDTSDFQTKIAGEVKDFRPEDFLTQKDARRTTTFIAYAVAATRMALEDSGLVIDQSNADRVGVFIGCGLGGLASLEETNRIIETRGPSRVSPFFIPMMIGNMAAGMISMQFGAKGPNACMATACAAGSHSIGDAFKLIQQGRADGMISGGVESVITPSCIAGFNAMKALSTRNDAPQKASRPFDRDRDGFVVGEGCGIVILETLEAARERGAHIYAEICGYGMSGDGYHMTAPSPDGEGAARCMLAAINDAGISYKQIDYINAHGTSTQLNDLYETRAVKTIFKDQAHLMPISSTKSMTGHLLGGAGGIETVITALTIDEGVIPPTINLDNPGEECDLDYVPHVSRKKDVEFAMTNSFGFGGTNGSLVLKKYRV